MDPFGLQRFVDAQDPVYERVVRELRARRKSSHWMWFIFPQIAGLGSSPTARRFAISSIEEARAYLEHPILGARLRESAGLVLKTQGGTVEEIFGYPDDLKFRSSMTLFDCASPGEIFSEALAKCFSGEPDPLTLAKL